MRWRFIGVVASLVAAVGVGGGLLWAAPWTDSQTASGEVAAQSTSELLYICENTGVPPPGAPIWCGADDDGTPAGPPGPDELIFEGDEDLTPAGAPATWDINLVNISTGVWDVTKVDVIITEVLDPDGGCTDKPDVSYSYISDAALFHNPGSEPIPGSQPIPGFVGPKIVHTGPNARATLRITVSLPESVQAECQGAAWDIVTEWTVQPHD